MVSLTVGLDKDDGDGGDLLRHPHGGSFLRPAKVSFGVDYVTAVQQQYKMDADFPDEAVDAIEWRVKERRYDHLCVNGWDQLTS